MKKLFLLLLISAGLVTACTDDDDSGFTCADFQVGDSISLPGSSESLFIDAVYQDNRCPCDAACIIGGGIGFRLLTAANDTLLIGKGDGSVPKDSLTYNGNLLVLWEVTTAPACRPEELAQADYCADFRVE